MKFQVFSLEKKTPEDVENMVSSLSNNLRLVYLDKSVGNVEISVIFHLLRIFVGREIVVIMSTLILVVKAVTYARHSDPKLIRVCRMKNRKTGHWPKNNMIRQLSVKCFLAVEGSQGGKGGGITWNRAHIRFMRKTPPRKTCRFSP